MFFRFLEKIAKKICAYTVLTSEKRRVSNRVHSTVSASLQDRCDKSRSLGMIELARELARYQFLYQSNVPVFPVENCRFGTGTSVFNKEKINIYFSSLLKPMYQFQNGSFQRRKLVHWTGTRTGTVPVHAPVQV